MLGLYFSCIPHIFQDLPNSPVCFPVKNLIIFTANFSSRPKTLFSLPLQLVLKFDNPFSKSKSLPQEQKPLEVKPARFVRSRFKRPKPNLARATLKRETTEAEKYVSGKKLETDKTEAVVVQHSSERMDTLPSQHVSAIQGGCCLF